MESLTARWEEMAAETVLPVRMLVVEQGTPVREAAICLRPRFMHILAVYDARMRLAGMVSEAELLRALLSDGDQPVGELEKVLNPAFSDKTH